MGLFEKALSFQKKKSGLYHRLLEYRKKWEEEPKSLYLKAKKLRESFENDQEKELVLPEYTIEKESSKEKDPELSNIVYDISSKKDLFEDWEKEAKEEIEKVEYEKQKEELEKKVFEDESEILTLPEEIHIAGQKRIDYYLVLFDIIEELNEIDHYDEFLENLAFIIQEQLGTQSILIFSNKEFPEKSERLNFEFEIGYKNLNFSISLKDPFFEYVNNPNEIYYLSQIEKNLKNMNSIFNQNNEIFQDFSNLIILKDSEEIYSLIFLSKPLNQPDYVLDDLEFLRVLNKISLAKIKQLKKYYKLNKEIQKVQDFSKYSKVIFDFILECSAKKQIDEIYDLLQNLLEKEFGIMMFSFILIVPNNGYYKLFAGKNISIESMQKFHLDINSDLVSLISNLTTLHPLENFKNYQDVIQNYTEEDISLMQDFIILPFVHFNWLIGFLAIHKTKNKLDQNQQEILLYLATYLASLLTNLILNEEKELIFRDAFSPLRKRIELEIQKAEETQSYFSVIDLKIKNLKKLLSVNNVSKLDQYLRKLIEIINSTLYKQDYLIRMAQARFLIILPKKSKEEAQIYLKKLLSRIKENNIFVDSPIQPTYSNEIYSYPKDADDLKKFIALIET